ncbi:hypothetical protein RhiJN_27550 [Ceratobasidium sp. AG-Ba]|nr:hypothetical protein RhiJN_13490 [Ceratobasidium sp. AG-Ba]QRV99531.1 hypothetical protein RhiJN_27550 [Ceratobasidium sp. AG-Ba]
MDPTRPTLRRPQVPDLPSQRDCHCIPSHKRIFSDPPDDSSTHFKKRRRTLMEISTSLGSNSPSDAINMLERAYEDAELANSTSPTQSSSIFPAFLPLEALESTSLEAHHPTTPPPTSTSTATQDPVREPRLNEASNPEPISSDTRRSFLVSTLVKISSADVDPAPISVSDAKSLLAVGSRTMAHSANPRISS